jgi:aspartyl-tRNA(Asn)/glutamyl-tRNA(Gln) amidotransferase subunit A
MVAPLIEPLLKDDEAFFKVNRLLLRNPSAINYMDGCAWSLPCHEAGELPVGLMVSGLAGQDARLAQVALALENLINS